MNMSIKAKLIKAKSIKESNSVLTIFAMLSHFSRVRLCATP